jgi:hypothetical protein
LLKLRPFSYTTKSICDGADWAPAQYPVNLILFLKLTIPGRTRKCNDIADIRHARYKLYHPLKTQTKAGMGHRTQTTRI